MSNSPKHNKTEDENFAIISPSNEQTPPSSTQSPKLPPQPIPTNKPSSPTPTPTPNPKNPTKLQQAWKTTGLNPTALMIMIKPAVAATISMGIYQSHDVAKHYLNLGYLIIIISITTVPILPRGKFVMNLAVSVFLTLFGCGMVTLGQYCGIKARQHTTPANASIAVATGYNSSASAVNAIFFLINIFSISTLKASYPALSIPSIQYTIIISVGFSYGPQQPTIQASHRFIKELLYSFLTGQGIATAVDLLVIPVSSRDVFFKQVTGLLRGVGGVWGGVLRVFEEGGRSCGGGGVIKDGKEEGERKQKFLQHTKALKSSTSALLSLGAKIRGDAVFARRESAWGYLTEVDISDLYALLRGVLIPVSALGGIGDCFEDMFSWGEGGEDEVEGGNGSEEEKENERKEWTAMTKALISTFESVNVVLDESILHILILLKLIPDPDPNRESSSRPQKSQDQIDIEKGDEYQERGREAETKPKPGEIGHANYLERKIKMFREQRTRELKVWVEERGLSGVFHDRMNGFDNGKVEEVGKVDKREGVAARRLRVVMVMEFLVYSTANSILTLSRFVELKHTSGTFASPHFIFPKLKTLQKWVFGLFSGDPSSGPNLGNLDDEQMEISETVYLGASFSPPKDPEHLPPRNALQRFGDGIRVIPRFLGGESVRFGVRVTIATFSLMIMAYLHSTHKFFISQRVVWACIMTGIGMSPSSGSAVFTLLGNLTFTLFGMIGAFINWYIVDQKTVGVIIVFFFMMMGYFYWIAKYPRFLIAIVAGALTHVLIIGYELQVRVIGIKQATATGQEYYPLYKLAPYRLLSVGAGVLVGYIFTVFPVPITEASLLRRDLGLSLFLLSKYLSTVTATVDLRLANKEGDLSLKNSPGRRLEKLRRKVLERLVKLLGSMRANLGFMPWDFRLGGEFPRELYGELVDEVQNIINHLTIIAYATESFPSFHNPSDTSSSQQQPWLTRFAHFRRTTTPESHHLTTLLSLLSASLRNAQPLPPYLNLGETSRVQDRLVNEGVEILELSNLDEPGFRAVAVVETGQRCVIRSVNNCVRIVRDIVGEVDFSFRVVGSGEGGLVFGGVDEDQVGGGKVKNS